MFSQGKPALIVLFLFLHFLTHVKGQSHIGCNQITAEMGFKVRSVRIEGRYVPGGLQKKVEATVGVGKLYDPSTVSLAQKIVSDTLSEGENTFPINVIGATAVLYVDANTCDVSEITHPKEVEITIQSYYIRVDLFSLGNNILPVPRGPKPTFYEEVPAVLLLTTPVVGLSTDRNFGPSISIETSTDLLRLPQGLSKVNNPRKKKLELGIDGQKSLSDPYYKIAGSLQLSQPLYTDAGIGWRLGMALLKRSDPVITQNNISQAARFWTSLTGNLSFGFLNKYLVNGGVRVINNQYASKTFQSVDTKALVYTISTLADGRIGRGFNRLGIWFDAGKDKTAINSYQRLAGQYAFSLPLGTGHQSADLEVNLGGGQIWGNPPLFQEFYAGNASSNFLYESFLSNRHLELPTGPLIRSLGQNEGGLSSASSLTGGQSYWHLNLNFSVPVPKWSKPLIPDVLLDESRGFTLRKALKGSIKTAANFIANDLESNSGFSEGKSDSLADKIVEKDIRPTINYLADRANVYAIRPIILFDIGGMSSHYPSSRNWIATGVGLQVNIVNARLESGYLRTVSPSSEKVKGNIFFRLTIQNFY